MTARGLNKVHRQKCLKTGFAKVRLGWAGRKGRHGGEALAMCGGVFSVPSVASVFGEKRRDESASLQVFSVQICVIRVRGNHTR